MRRHTADLRDQHREAGIALEEVLDGDVERTRVGVLLLDRLGDHRRVGRQRARVVRHEERPAGGREVLDPLDLDPEPVPVQELGDGRVEQTLDPLGAAPVVQLTLGLDAREVRLQTVGGHKRLHGRLVVAA
jgi:hypothetical protein